MSCLWKWVDSRKHSKEVKIKIFIALNCLQFSALGFLLWLVVSRFALSTYDWAICFIGYPGFFIGYIGGFIFLYRKG